MMLHVSCFTDERRGYSEKCRSGPRGMPATNSCKRVNLIIDRRIE
jgi:hypothetical protein